MATAAEKRLFPPGVTSLKQFAEITRTSAEAERQPKEAKWADIRDMFSPERLRLNDEHTGGDQEEEPDDHNITNNTGRRASIIFRSGMVAGITNPNREWVKISTPDPDDAEIGRVKTWLETVTKRMTAVFLKSNLYEVIPSVYRDAGDFATGGMLVMEDFQDVMRFESIPLGTYSLGADKRGIVNVFTRNYQRTVRQIAEQFLIDTPGGQIHWERASDKVKEAYDQGQHNNYFPIRHVIMPNIDWRPGDPFSKKYLSLYYEASTGTASSSASSSEINDIFLKRSGFDYFPFLALRWDKSGQSVWGDESPGWIALGDNLSLQEMEKDAQQVIAQEARPAMQGPTSVENAGPSIVPGDSTFYNVREGLEGFRRVFEANMPIDKLEAKITKTEDRIKDAYFTNLFRAITDIDRGVTATEVLERKAEKLLELGPALQRVNDDLLDKLIDITFIIMDRQDMIPEAPEELLGKALKIEYISIMHLAQKSAGLESIERYTNYVVTVAGMTQTLPKTFDPEGAVADYAERAGIGTGPTRSKEEVEALKFAEQQAIAQEQQREQMLANAKAAKDLSGAELSEDNALGAIVEEVEA